MFLLFGHFTDLFFSGRGISKCSPTFLDFSSINFKNFWSSNEISSMLLDASIPNPSLDPQNSVLHMFFNICLVLISLTLLDIPKWLDAIFSVAASCTTIQLQEIEVFFPNLVNIPTTHHPNRVLKKKGPPFLLGGSSSGSNAFEQFAPMSNPISILVSVGNLSAMIFKCFHFFAFSWVNTSSTSAARASLVYVARRFSYLIPSPWTFLETFNPVTMFHSIFCFPFNVLIVISVFLPLIPSFSLMLSFINVPWLQLSNMASVDTSCLVPTWPILTGTTQMLMIFAGIPAEAHFKSISAKMKM